MLDIAMPEPRLQRSRIMSLVGKLVAAAVAQHVGMDGEDMPARSPRRAINAWKLFGAIGAPRSEANT
jgi:hypothetical protein